MAQQHEPPAPAGCGICGQPTEVFVLFISRERLDPQEFCEKHAYILEQVVATMKVVQGAESGGK